MLIRFQFIVGALARLGRMLSPITAPTIGNRARRDAISDSDEPAQTTPTSTSDPALTGLAVLVIDDHPYVCDLLRDSLQRLGAHVTTSADGASGLEAVARSRPDVILLDLKLPDRSPEEMLAGLREPSASSEVPWIVGLSASATEAEIQRVLDRGVNDFLLKPVSIDGLVETLRLSPAGAKIASAARANAHVATATNPRLASGGQRTALLAETAPAIERVAHACHIGDSDRAATEAHYLANSCVMLGLESARVACRSLEDAAQRDDLVGAREILVTLRAEIDRARARESAAVR
jgi:CheY-like chemotaxis protein